MAKRKKNPQQEELELEQAYVELTGYKIRKKKKSGCLPAFICLLAVLIAGCALSLPYLLERVSEPTTPSTRPTSAPTETTNQSGTSEPTTVVNDRLPEGLTFGGIDLSGMTAEEAAGALMGLYTSDMTVLIGDYAYTLTCGEAVYGYNAHGAAKALLENPDRFSMSDWLTLNEGTIQKQVLAWTDEYQYTVVPTSYTIVGEMPSLEPLDSEPECQTLMITKGTPALTADADALYQSILDSYYAGSFTVEAAVAYREPEPLDLTAVFDSCFIAPVDAVMDKTTFRVTGGTCGYEFDVFGANMLLEEAEYGATVEIPFYRTPPAVTAASLEALLFRDVLSSTSTAHTDEYNRNTNLRLACQAINGVVLYPGQEFSYNDALGERTTGKGYLPAGSYVAGATVDTVGGGICQVSSTLYYSCLKADLEITLRDCHMYAVSYLPLGIDATINWGSYDYRFRNNTNYPIRIEAWMADGYVHIQLIGTDEKDYYVKIENVVEKTIPYETVYEEMYADNPDGYRDGDQITSPYTGYTVRTYRCKYDKATDELISRDYEDHSEYWARNEVIVKIIEPPTEAPTEPTLAPETDPTETQ